MRIFLFGLTFLIISSTAIGQSEITLEDIWKNYKYYAKSVPGFNFMKDGKHYSKLDNQVIRKYDITTGKSLETILDVTTLKGQASFGGEISSYSFSDDESMIILESERESIYRRSSQAYYHIYNRSDKELLAVYEFDKVQYASLSPDNKKVAYVWKNNLYWMDIETGITEPVTDDGQKNTVINGATDWVYEEEFAFAKAFAWSPDSKKIAYIRFDESDVKEFTMTYYENDLYPRYETFKYPKVGEANARVSTHIFHLDGKTINVELGDLSDMYIPRIKWTQSSDQLCVFKMNRYQNELELLLCDSKTGQSQSLLKEQNEYYIDITDNLTFLKNGRQFVWTSELSGYNHIYLYNMSGRLEKQLTKGNWDVTDFYGVDEANGLAYYQAAKKNPMQREVYQVSLKRGKSKPVADNSGTNAAQFSSTYDYYVWSHSTVNSPRSYAVHARSGQKLRVLEDNKQLVSQMKDMKLPKVSFFDFDISKDTKLNGWMIKPNDFDPSKKYPVLMYVYGGPGSQTVTDAWKGQNYWWFQMLAQNGYIVASVDNRGTGARGEKFKKMTYLTLGKYETQDQISAAQYLAGQNYIDDDRIGIFGWSYGGFMASHCITQGADVFDTAIAVAPVTNWKWYDTIYTERYMRTPAENNDGYEDNSPVNYADRLTGAYLLVHGITDDNVHFQNAAEMANALISANKQFDTYYYPNRNHGIYGDNARLHLYQKMTDFLMENL